MPILCPGSRRTRRSHWTRFGSLMPGSSGWRHRQSSPMHTLNPSLLPLPTPPPSPCHLFPFIFRRGIPVTRHSLPRFDLSLSPASPSTHPASVHLATPQVRSRVCGRVRGGCGRRVCARQALEAMIAPHAPGRICVYSSRHSPSTPRAPIARRAVPRRAVSQWLGADGWRGEEVTTPWGGTVR